ncbi:hypothetical protein SEA_KWEKEL_59 [Gordonia phage Kwekel]|uniref:Uncharacterized protein n=1 Tax=Gordonia phage Kwekel TaxID=3077820 RepID=A0AA96KMV2_9CAUD|nr:hypothetical protein SEA_KWEKEL_59 [Gordonia phage Kwekel]
MTDLMTTIYQHPDTGHLATYSPRAGNDDPNPWVEYACTPFAFSEIGRHPELPFGYLALLLVPPPAVGTILDGLIEVKPDDAVLAGTEAPRAIPDGPPMFVVECLCTDAESIRCRAHGPSPDDWADQVDDQRKRADATAEDLTEAIAALSAVADRIDELGSRTRQEARNAQQYRR